MAALKISHSYLEDLRSETKALLQGASGLDRLFYKEAASLKREDEASTLRAVYRTIVEQFQDLKRIEISASLGHSQANLVAVSLVYNDGVVSLTVEDNGLGFDAKHKPGGMGLRTIRERVESIGGQACIQSQPGQGTKIEITAPFNGHVS